MKALHRLGLLFLTATIALTSTPAHAVVAIFPPPPRPAPAGWVYRWIPAAYRTLREQTWIPDRIDIVRDWVEVAPGRFEQVWRQVIIPGHYELTTRTIQVSDGYWQLVRLDPPMPPIPMPSPVVINAGTVGVEGYPTLPTEDLRKFSPLREWPAPR